MTLHVNLTPELEKSVRERVRRGTHRSASEVVREALRLLAAHEAESQGAGPHRRRGSRSQVEFDRQQDRTGAGLWPVPAPKEETMASREPAGREELVTRLHEAFELIGLAYAIVGQTFRREHPGEPEETIARRVADWATGDRGQEAPGHLVRSPARLERLLRDRR